MRDANSDLQHDAWETSRPEGPRIKEHCQGAVVVAVNLLRLSLRDAEKCPHVRRRT